jgi:hypothetical protein
MQEGSGFASHLVFLSYSRRDATLVRVLALMVKAAGVGVWRDEESIQAGDRWPLAITRNIEACDRFLVFWCAHARDSQMVEAECRQAARARKTIVPVQLDDTRLSFLLRDYQAIDVSGLTKWPHRWRWMRWIGLVGLALMLLGSLGVRVRT